MRSIGAVAGVLLASSAAFADGKVPPGWMVIGDSAAQFSGTQGADRWWYLFDRGEGTQAEQMPYFGSSGLLAGSPGWTTCASFTCYCIQQGSRMHANSTGACSAPWAGLLRPIRRWEAPTSMPIWIEFVGSIPTNTTGLQVDLILDGSVVFTQLSQNGANTQISWTQAILGQRLDLRLDPVGDNCNADVLDAFKLRILTPDCNGNLIADAIEIANGSAGDANGDGVPDGCQCFGDVIQNGVVDGADLSALLSVWGTAGGIYPRADANGDGVVNGSDLSIVLSGWGACAQ